MTRPTKMIEVKSRKPLPPLKLTRRERDFNIAQLRIVSAWWTQAAVTRKKPKDQQAAQARADNCNALADKFALLGR